MASQRMRIQSSPALELGGGKFANRRWMELLDSVGSTRSISAAAKAVGLSYKAAWDAVDALNNLSGAPLVTRSKGGKGGGGTELTARGRQLVDTYRAVEEENTRFLQALNRRIGSADRNLRIIGRMAMLTSARNHLSGKVVRIARGAVNDELELELPGGERLVAVITRESTEHLGLKKGSAVVALIKASSVLVAAGTGEKLKLSARNRLSGTVSRVTTGAVNSEVVIALKGGNSIAAIVTNRSAKELKLAKGKQATAIFKASSVILGVSA